MKQLSVRPLAWREVNSIFDYLEDNAGLDAAIRFVN